MLFLLFVLMFTTVITLMSAAMLLSRSPRLAVMLFLIGLGRGSIERDPLRWLRHAGPTGAPV